jgi:hypothetical protein
VAYPATTKFTFATLILHRKKDTISNWIEYKGMQEKEGTDIYLQNNPHQKVINKKSSQGQSLRNETFSLWWYSLSSFQEGGPKFERFLPKNQHTHRKLLNSENWCTAVHRTEVRFASFLSGGFATMAVANPPERKLTKHISVHRRAFKNLASF